ncbi:hypothetical protein ACWD25_11555 [Streptomyces sp. NPDC002920]
MRDTTDETDTRGTTDPRSTRSTTGTTGTAPGTRGGAPAVGKDGAAVKDGHVDGGKDGHVDGGDVDEIAARRGSGAVPSAGRGTGSDTDTGTGTGTGTSAARGSDTRSTTGTGTGTGTRSTTGTGTGSGTTAGTDVKGSALVSRDECDKLAARMEHAVVGFVDGPRDAVTEADRVLEELATRVTEAMNSRRRSLRGSWQQSADNGDTSTRNIDASNTDTEQLRLALRDYRELTERLLHV